MKKELLMASALVSTMGVASVAEAVTSTMSGHHNVGVKGSSIDSGSADTTSVTENAAFSVSLSEVTDGGTTIASGFMLANESVNAGTNTGAITLTFTDGSKLDVFNAGSAAASHDIAVPSGAGEQGVTVTTSNSATNSLDFMGGSTELGVEWHSAADFMADGLKIGASYSTDNGAAKGASTKIESHWGLGATYVTTAGDSTITMGMGLSDTTYGDTGSQPSADEQGYHVGLSAVTGDLTVAAGFATGDDIRYESTDTDREVQQEVTKVGLSYVSGDLTMKLGFASGSARDGTVGTAGTTDDSLETTSASVQYAVASGVTATIGYANVDSQDEGANETSGGSSWYLGANLAF